MAITFDSVTTGNCNPGTSVSFSHTTTGSNTIVWLLIWQSSATDKVSSTPTYGGASMTLGFDAGQIKSGVYAKFYYIVSPAGGSQTVTFNLSSSISCVASAQSYVGVAQTSPVDVTGTAADASNKNWSWSVSPTNANSWAVSIFSCNEAYSDVTGVTRATGITTATGFMDTNGAGGSFSVSNPDVGSIASATVSFFPLSTPSGANVMMMGV